jgi:hypothetical protein
MLRLLAQREEGYDDIAALMGLSVEEVRAKVKEALEAVDDSDSPPKPDAAPQQPPAPSSPEPPKQQPKPSGSDSPAKPSASKEAPKPKSTSPSRPAFRGDRPGLKLPAGRSGRLAILTGAAVVVLMVVLLLVTGGSGDEGSSSSDASSTTTATTAANGSDLLRDKRITGAVLTSPDGGDASGLAVLGRNGKEPLLQIEADGLEPSPEGETYTIWLYKSPKLVLRAGAVKEVGDNGLLVTQLPIPLEVLQYIAAGAFDQIDVSLTSDAAYEAELTAAKKGKRLPRYIGTSVLRGEIVGPLVNAGKGQGG